MQNAASTGGDDFIPAPSTNSTAAVPSDTATSNTIANPDAMPIKIGAGPSQTAMILAIVAVLALAALLLIVRGAVRKSLIAGRATIDAANAAAWSWYTATLLFGALVVAGIAGGLFSHTYYIGLTVAVLVIGLTISMMMTSRARQSA